MVLALSLPPEFGHRSLIVTMTFGVVTLSILGQGLTMPMLLRRLSLTAGPAAKRLQAFEAAREDFRAARAALEELDYLSAAGFLPATIDRMLRERYVPRLARAGTRLKASVDAMAGVADGAAVDSVAVRATGTDMMETSMQAGGRSDMESPSWDTAGMVRRIERYLLDVERDRLGDALRAGSMSTETFTQLVAELDERRAELDAL